MKTKKLIALLLSVMLIIGVAGCTGDSGEPVIPANVPDDDLRSVVGDDSQGNGDSETGESGVVVLDKTARTPNVADIPGVDFNAPPVQLVVYSQTANYSGKLTGWFAEVMRREFNVEMTIIPQPDPGIFDTRMETGNLGDIVIFGSNGAQYQRAVNEGMLFNWNEDDILSEFGPYIKASMPYALEHNAELNQSVTGNKIVHGIGHDIATSPDDHDSFMYTWDIRWDLYKELGYPTVRNLDDLYGLLLGMKSISPKDDNGNESYAVSLWPDWDGNMVMYVKAFATAYWGHDELGFGLYDVETGEFYFAIDEGGPYIESLRFFNRLHQAGLVDPDSMVQKYEDMSKKLLSSGVFLSIFDYAGSLTYNSDENLAAGRMMYTLNPEESTPIAYGMNVRGGNRVWSIGANTEYPELCMAIINWLSTPEGAMTYWYGPKDLCWYYDDDGFTNLTELGEAAKKDRRNTNMPAEWGGGTFNEGNFQANNTIWSVDASNPDSNGETYNADFWHSRRTGAEYDIQQDWMDFTGFYDYEEFLRSRPYKLSLATSYTESTRSDDLELIWNQVKQCIVDETWKAMFASSDAEFDAIVAGMRQKVNEYDPGGECLKWCQNEAAIRRSLEPR